MFGNATPVLLVEQQQQGLLALFEIVAADNAWAVVTEKGRFRGGLREGGVWLVRR